MFLAPDKKVILRFFSRHKVICLCAEFEVCQTPGTGFLPIDTTFLANIWCKYFSSNIWTVVHQSKLKLSDLDQNWAKTGHLLFKTFESLISIDSSIVHWQLSDCGVVHSCGSATCCRLHPDSVVGHHWWLQASNFVSGHPTVTPISCRLCCVIEEPPSWLLSLMQASAMGDKITGTITGGGRIRPKRVSGESEMLRWSPESKERGGRLLKPGARASSLPTANGPPPTKEVRTTLRVF